MPLIGANVGRAVVQFLVNVPQRAVFSGRFGSHQVRFASGSDAGRMQATLRYPELREQECCKKPLTNREIQVEASSSKKPASSREYTTSRGRELPELHDQAVS